MKSQASGSAGDKKKPWTFYSNMEFLIPYIEFKETTGNYACQSPVQSQEVSEPQIEQLQEQLELAAEVPEDVPVQPGSSRNQQDRDITEARATRKRKRSKPMNSESTEAKILQVLSEKYDPDEHFLLSLLPSLKRLNPKKNAEARIKLQQTLYEIEFSNRETQSCSNYSFSTNFSMSAPPSVSSVCDDPPAPYQIMFSPDSVASSISDKSYTHQYSGKMDHNI